MADRFKYLDLLFPESGGEVFIEDLWLKKYTLQHGDVSRLPECLQAPDGAFAGIHCLEEWRKGDPYDVAVVDDIDYSQYKGSDFPPMAMYRIGAPIMLANPHRRNKEFEDWVSKVSTELAVPDEFVTVTAWFARKSRGLGIHYDPGEVILIQLVGNKKMRVAVNQFTTMPDAQFELRKPCRERALTLFPNGFPTEESIIDSMEEIELQPGSVLAMPRGTWHDSVALDSDSVAIALYFRTPTVTDLVISYLQDLLRQDPLWRTPLFCRKQANENTREIQQSIDTIAARLETLQNYVRDIHPEQVITHSHPAYTRTCQPKQADYALQRLPETKFTIESVRPGTSQVTLHARMDMERNKVSKLELDNDIIQALEWIANKQSRFTLQELSTAFPELPPSHLRGLIEVLLETNFVVLLPFPTPNNST